MPQQIEIEPVARHNPDTRRHQRPPARKEAPEQQPKQGRRSLMFTLCLVIGILLAVVAGMSYYAQSQTFQSTDDAFIDGHIINVSPKVAGRVERVLVNDNQLVKQGDLVVVLDGRDFAAASEQKAAALESTRAQAGAV